METKDTEIQALVASIREAATELTIARAVSAAAAGAAWEARVRADQRQDEFLIAQRALLEAISGKDLPSPFFSLWLPRDKSEIDTAKTDGPNAVA
jgi:hypothetical protein